MVLSGTQTVTGAKTFSAGTLISGSGTATNAPHVYTPSGATLKTTPTAGDQEVDANGIQYYTHSSGERGFVTANQWISLTSAYTLTSQTAVQKIFNSSTNGAVTVAARTYEFECQFSLTAMSATSGSFGFALGGTAVLASQAWHSSAAKVAFTGGSPIYQFNTSASTSLTSSNTNTTGYATIKGIIRVTTGGTLIPQVSLGAAAAAIVGANSFFKLTPIGSNTVTTIGAWQ